MAGELSYCAPCPAIATQVLRESLPVEHADAYVGDLAGVVANRVEGPEDTHLSDLVGQFGDVEGYMGTLGDETEDDVVDFDGVIGEQAQETAGRIRDYVGSAGETPEPEFDALRACAARIASGECALLKNL